MKIKLVFLGLLGGPSLVDAASKVISPAEQRRIENEINNARRDTVVSASNMRYIQYNPAVQNALESYRNAVGSISFNIPPYGADVMQDERIPAEYHDWEYLLHDTSGDADNSISEIFNFRAVKQKRCYSQPACSKEEFTGYRTCYNTAVPKSVNCNWFFQYYPKIVFAELKEIACVRLGIPGRVNLHSQPNSFFCYGLKLDARGKAITDYPQDDQSFEVGARCSKCPDDQPLCRDKLLCISQDMTRKPSAIPTAKPSKKPTTSKPTTIKPTVKGFTYSPTTLSPASKQPTKRKKLHVV